MGEHRLGVRAVTEADVIHLDVPLHRSDIPGVGGVGDLRLHPHELHEPFEARHALHELLHKGGELTDGGDEGGDIEGKGDQVDIVHPAPHDEEAAGRDDQDRHQAHGQLHPRVVDRHGPVVAPLGPPELGVGPLELVDLGVFVGKGLGGAHTRDGGLKVPVDARQLPFYLGGCLHHPFALPHREEDEERHHGKDDESQLPTNGKHDAEGPRQGDDGDEQVLRAVMGQLRDLEQVAGDPAHKLAGAVLVIKGKGQVLHMGKEIGADIRLDAHTQQVSPIGDDEGEHALEHIGQQQHGHEGEEGTVQAPGQQLVECVTGNHGEQQVHQADAQRADHVQQEDGQMGSVIRHEDAQIAAAPHLFRGHRAPPFQYWDQ